MTTSIRDILRQGRMQTHFLPVLDVRLRSVHAWEALVRGSDGASCDSSFPLLHAAQEENLRAEFELASIRHAVDRFRYHDPGVKLWLNAGLDLLQDQFFVDELREMLNESRANPSETQFVTRMPSGMTTEQREPIAAALQNLQPFDVVVAFEQLPDSRQFAELCRGLPALHCLKIGRHAIRDLPSRAIKRMHLEDLANKARECKIHLIAEGVETIAELNAIRPLQPKFIQGFLFGRPGDPPQVNIQLLGNVEFSLPPTRKRDDWKCIGDLMTPAPVATRATPLATIQELLAHHPILPGIPVLEDTRPVGWIHKGDVQALQAEATARDLLDPSIKLADAHEEPADVHLRLVEESQGTTRLPEVVFVLWDGLYQGIVRLETLKEHLQD